MKLSPRQSAILLAVLFVALNAAAAWLTFGVLAKSVLATSRAVRERRATESEYISRAREADRARLTLEAISRDETKLQNFFIGPADVLPFILAAEANARQTQVSQTITFLAPAAGQSGSALSLQIAAEGAFPDLVKYMALIENMPAYVTLTNVGFRIKSRPAAPADAPARVGLVYNLTVATTKPITQLNAMQP